jgi:hypothetical protein
MNERLKELAFKAYNNAGQGTQEALSSFMEVYSEKFAELIVRECMEHANEIGRLNHGRGSWHSVRDRISIKMLGIYPKSGPIMPLKNE